MAHSNFNELIEDAILVAKYGQRSGRFKDDSLFVAIQKAIANRTIGWESPEAVDLQKALNGAVPLIHPVTLVDLKRWDPYGFPDRYNDSKSSRSNLAFVATAILLTFLCGYYTIWHNNAAEMISNPAAAKVAEQQAVINELLYPLLSSDQKVLSDLGIPISPVSITYREKIERIKSLEQTITASQQQYTDLTTTLFPVTVIYYNIRSWIFTPDYPTGAVTVDATSAASSESAKPVSGTTVIKAQAPTFSPQYSFGFDSCQTAGSAGTLPLQIDQQLDGKSPLFGFQTSRQKESQWLVQFRCAIGLRYSEAPKMELANNFRQYTDVLGLWILPALYGALGALMYFMRSILNPLLPNPNLGRVLLRISLSTFAGIAVAWFWTPGNAGPLMSGDITFGMLALAFLVGFSIDIFFGLLDRLVNLATASIAKIGASG